MCVCCLVCDVVCVCVVGCVCDRLGAVFCVCAIVMGPVLCE